MMKNVLICSNPERDIGLETAKRITELIKNRADVKTVPLNYGERSFSAVQSEMENAELIVAIGGDGSIMHAARAAAPLGKSIIGVNRGDKGFLADLDGENIGLISAVLDGKYTRDPRMMLDVSVIRDGKRAYYDYAINDAVIGGVSRLVSVGVYTDGIKVAEFAGDGVIIASPTGSTAYSMSAGGPIVEPGAENIVITPVCSHALIAKPFVLSAERVITTRSNSRTDTATYLTVDGGKGVLLEKNDTVEVRRSRYTAEFIKVTGKTFYETVAEKLGVRK